MQSLALRFRSLAVPLLAIFAFAAAGILATRLTAVEPLIGAGVAYVVIFLLVTWYRPEIALLLIFATAPFQNDLSDGAAAKFSIAEINLALAVLVYLFRVVPSKRPISLGPISFPIFFYFALCLFSSMQDVRLSTVISLVQMGLYLVITVLVFSALVKKPEDFLLSLHGLIFVGVCLAVVGIATSSQYFLGLHKNGVGASISCALLVCLDQWLAAKSNTRRAIFMIALGVMTAGLVLTLSRGAWLSSMAGIFVIALLRRAFLRLLAFGLILAPLVAICWLCLPAESREYATGLEADRVNIKARYETIAMAYDFFKQSPIYGVGVGLRKDQDSTNVILLNLAETGVLGLGMFLILNASLLCFAWKAKEIIPPDDPSFSLVVLGAALPMGKLAHGLVDHYWSRGALLIAWAAVGMSLAAYSYRIHSIRLKSIRSDN